MIPHAYRVLLGDRRARRLLSGLGVCALGDGMSMVTIAWLAVRTAPHGMLGLFVGLAMAAYSLPGAIGAIAFGSYLRHRSPRALVLAHCLLRAGFLGTVVVLATTGALSPVAYVVLLAGSSLLASWGTAGQYTLLAEVGGENGRLAANSLAGAQASFATIVGPAAAGLLLTQIAPTWLLGLDAASFAFLGLQAWRTSGETRRSEQPVDAQAAESGFRVLRRHGLLGLLVVTWFFFFLYGPVETALPVYVAHDLHEHAGVLGMYWTSFGIGALVSTLLVGTLRRSATRRVTLMIVAGWGACLLPFAFAAHTGLHYYVGRTSVPLMTLVPFAIGGLIYGPFVPITYALFQSIATPANLPSVLAARSAALIVAAPLGTAIGGPIVAGIGAGWTLTASGFTTIIVAAVATVAWRRHGYTPHDSHTAAINYHLPIQESS